MNSSQTQPHSAVLIVDFQVGTVAAAHRRADVLANLQAVVAKARAAGVPVIWVQDLGQDRSPGSEAWQLVPELGALPEEPRVQKRYGDSFEETELAELLTAGGIGRLYVAGAQTDACVRSTLHGAVTRGYQTFLISDAHTTEDLSAWGNPSPEQVIAHTNLYWAYHNAPVATGVVTTEELSFADRADG